MSEARKPRIVFLCVHNAGRSQMAAGFARTIGDGKVDVFSGGSEPAESVNPVAVEAMHEVGVDIEDQLPRPWTLELIESADVVITMGCGDSCPVVPGTRYVDWELDDPSAKSLDEVRVIRDEIGERVRGLIDEVV